MLKLPSHSRYSYSPIVKRPDYSWPGGKRLAFYIALNIEHFAFGAGSGMDPVRSGQQTTRNFAWRDYGNRIGNWRLFEMLDELKLPATILLNSCVCDHYPEIIEKIKTRGDDVLGHGRTNAELMRGMWEGDEERAIKECTETIAKHVGVRPTGWMGPGALESNVTPDLLKEAGYTHLLDWPFDDQPVWMQTRAGPLLSVPYPMELQRRRRARAPRPDRPAICRNDRRSVRRNAGTVRATAAGVCAGAARLHRRPAVSASPVAAGDQALRREGGRPGLVYPRVGDREFLFRDDEGGHSRELSGAQDQARTYDSRRAGWDARSAANARAGCVQFKLPPARLSLILRMILSEKSATLRDHALI